MVDRQALIEDVLDDAGARLGAFGWLLTGSDERAAELVRDGLASAFGSLRAPRTLPAAEAATRRQMARLAARGRSAPRRDDSATADDSVHDARAVHKPSDEAMPDASVAASTPSTEDPWAAWAPPSSHEDDADPGTHASAPGSDDESGPDRQPRPTFPAPVDPTGDVRREPEREAAGQGNPALASALSQMDPEVRVAVVLAEVDGLTPARIGRLIRRSAHRVEADLAHGRAILGPVLGVHDDGFEYVDVVTSARR